MSISKGNTGIGKAYVGTKEVEKAFVGDKLVYQSGVPADPVFANNDWATIRAVVRSGNIPASWAIGNTKNITLSNGQTIAYRICDKQAGRYALADGSGSSNMVLEPVDLITGLTAKMNATAINNGGFAQSQMRIVTLASVLALFPSDVQAAMSEVLVLSGTGNSTTTGVSSSANKLFLAAEMEIWKYKEYSIGLEECPLGEYDYYKQFTDGATTADLQARIKKKSGSAEWYWLRSPVSNISNGFCAVGSSGGKQWSQATVTNAIAPFFAI